MGIKDEKLNKLNKELQDLERTLDKTKVKKEIEDLKRQRKNLKERIRIRRKSILNYETEPIVHIKQKSLSENVGYEIVRGNTNAVLIAAKYGAKIKSVRWYLCKKK